MSPLQAPRPPQAPFSHHHHHHRKRHFTIVPLFLIGPQYVPTHRRMNEASGPTHEKVVKSVLWYYYASTFREAVDAAPLIHFTPRTIARPSLRPSVREPLPQYLPLAMRRRYYFSTTAALRARPCRLPIGCPDR